MTTVRTYFEGYVPVRSVLFNDAGEVIAERTCPRPAPRSPATRNRAAAVAAPNRGGPVGTQTRAPAGRQQHEREVDAAISAGRVPSSTRSAWLRAFEQNASQARRELVAQQAPRPASLDRAVRSLPGGGAR